MREESEIGPSSNANGLDTGIAGVSRREWLRRGVAGGDPEAMLTLGRLYWEGERVPKNIPEGTRLLRQAEALGSEEARHELALPPL